MNNKICKYCKHKGDREFKLGNQKHHYCKKKLEQDKDDRYGALMMTSETCEDFARSAICLSNVALQNETSTTN